METSEDKTTGQNNKIFTLLNRTNPHKHWVFGWTKRTVCTTI
ncbi:hypothetical protein CLOSTMETH_03601 [[Clostridium] methylpentosum DSM 5476]|uniref:Uncharacterized protein n=1 Tax=[Clostridium] methylpentosum DSM 5476 TaxID=537013 RepID=C0EIA6_9FIRM|nr:hypothetical protein CLOSTMETH_03601 [[Clostridium] methylpentosum DSM 5476]